jgi:O-antigen/teichoic acid export membrane protein
MDSLVGLVPIVAVPLLMSLSTILIADEQRRGGWKKLALIQFRAVLVAFVITLPLLFFIPSLLGPSINLAVIEALIYVQLRRGSAHILVTTNSKGASASTLKKRFREAFLYSTLGWGQSQLDRVAVGALGGSGLLGLYTFSWSISRSLGDAISNGSVNVLRAKIFAASTTSSEARIIVGKSLRQTLVLVVAGILVVFGALYWVLPHLLGSEWRSALNAAYILVLCTVPQAIASSSSVLLMHSAKMKAGLIVRVVGLACALPIGICAVADLRLGASAALLREILMCIVSMLIVRREAPWPTIGAGLLCVLFMFTGVASMGLFSQ